MFASKDTLLTRPSGYNIARSVRLRKSASAYLNRNPASNGTRTTWTYSTWVKRGQLGAGAIIHAQDSGNTVSTEFTFASDDTIYFREYGGASYTGYLQTTQVFRDPSAWYHLVLVWDSNNGTSGDRIRLYVNGTRITSFSTATYPSLGITTVWNSTNLNRIGFPSTSTMDGYLTEINFIDGQALTPSSFGETNPSTGVWQPAKYTGTYGTNGFYLNFSDNSNNTAATIGKDYSGNGNNWTPNNISVTAGVTYDSMVDSPTVGATSSNYAVINPVFKSSSQPTISNGNLTVAPSAATYQNAFSTIGSISGKQYCEITITGAPNSANMWGVANAAQLNSMTTTAEILGSSALSGTGYGYYYDGRKYTAGTLSSYGNAVSSGDVMGIALDLDNGKVWFSLNGTWQASGDPAAGTNAAFTGIVASGTWFFGATAHSGGSTTFNYNFGQRPFSYTPPIGFVALNTYNLSASTITNGAAYMNTLLYTGDGNTTKSITGLSFAPDFVWHKTRSNADDHRLVDIVRGGGTDLSSSILYSNLTNAQDNSSGYITQTSSGFNLGVAATPLNMNGRTYVAWNWKANGVGVSNINGTITSTVSVGATQGFSVITFDGTGANATVGHGLGVAPSMVIMKQRNNAGFQWPVYHGSLATDKYLFLQRTDGQLTSSTIWQNTRPTSSVIYLGPHGNDNNNTSSNMVAYCFAAVAGYSAFGSFGGNGSADGPFVYTGFRPAFVMAKLSSATGDWNMVDDMRQTYNDASGNPVLRANLNNTEEDVDTMQGQMDILSNGFKLRSNNSSLNANGGTIIYAAFAENPFKYALAR